MKKIISLIFVFILGMSFVLAQGIPSNAMGNIQTKTQTLLNYNLQQVEQIRNQFENKYQFNCFGTCDLSEVNNRIQLEVREQRKIFLFFNIDLVDKYDLNENGGIIQAKHNIWSRLLNQNRIRIN